MKEFVMEKMKEACGVFGIINNDDFDVSRLTYYGLYSLQHRGQESAGIAVKNGDTILCHKDMGLAHEVFDKVILNQLKGTIAIGHVRYSTTGASEVQNAQPMVLRYRNGNMSLAHNGNLVNAAELRDEMESQGAIFQSTNDTEVIANLISRYRVFNDNIVDTIKSVMADIRGSYAITMITPKRLVGMRDPLGIRPLCLGKLKNSYVIGDHPHDVEMGRKMGSKTIYLLTGHGLKHKAELSLAPDEICNDLYEAAMWILKEKEDKGGYRE